MSAKVDAERWEDAHEARAASSREVLQRLQRVATWTYEGTPVAEQARRLEVSRPTVRFWQRVLGWRVTRPPPCLRGRLHGEVRT